MRHKSPCSAVQALGKDQPPERESGKELLRNAHKNDSPLQGYPPHLNLEPSRFLAQLTSQYLYAVLHDVFYASLMAENRKRLEHMDNSIRRLEKDEAKLRMRYNALRQEEIIEEIEIIMLSVDALTEEGDVP